jgi:hypothetical protein
MERLENSEPPEALDKDRVPSYNARRIFQGAAGFLQIKSAPR